MKHLRKFNEEFTDDHKENLSDRNRRYNELKSIKIKLYESQNPPMVEVFQDLNDYLLELTDKYGEVESKYGDVRPVIDFDDLDLVVDVGKDNDYLIASEKNYIWQGFNRVEMDPTQIETSKKLSMYDYWERCLECMG